MSAQDPGASLRAVAARIEAEKGEILTRAGLVLAGAVKEEYSTPGRGRLRRKSRADRASAPGDPPAPDTGALRNSVDVVAAPDGQSVRVGTNQEYAAALEFGTVRIAPRPAWRPALEKARAGMGAVVVSELQRVVSGAGA